jgi:hypothetical protein
MNPAAITTLTQICISRHLDQKSDLAHLISNFLTTWSAWEAIRTRLIRVIIHKQGWLIKDADAALRIAKLSSMKSAGNLLCRLGLADPSHWKGCSGRTWRALLSVEPLRHRLTHGFHSADPKLILVATDIVLEAILNQEWLEILEISPKRDMEECTLLGSIMTPRGIKVKGDRLERQKLFEILDIREQKRSSSLPSLSRLEEHLKKIKQE